MAWNYFGDPSNHSSDAVRLLIGDTDANDPILNDEVIEFLIAEEPNIYYAAAGAAMACAAMLSRLEKPDARRYQELAVVLRMRAGQKEPGLVFAGGITRTGITNPSGLPDPFFYRGMHDIETPNDDYILPSEE